MGLVALGLLAAVGSIRLSQPCAFLRDAHHRFPDCFCALFVTAAAPLDRALHHPPQLAAFVMPPRRSNAAAKRAAEDLTDEADDAKRHKVNGEPMAADASAAAAAAASSSSSAGAASASSSQRSDSALAAAAAAIPLPDTPSCSICMEPFPAAECKEEGGAGRVPRSLPCPKLHTYCSDCLEGMLHHEDSGADGERSERHCAHSRNHIVDAALRDVRSVCSQMLIPLLALVSLSSRTFARCAGCRFEFTLRMPDRPASAAAGAAAAETTAAEWVRLIPINSELMESIGHRRQLERMVSERDQQLQKLSATRCSYPDCQQSALFWCDQCEGELCAAHDRSLHPAAAAASSSAAHRRISTSERAAARQAKMVAQLAANGANLRAAVLQTKKETDDRTAAVAARLVAETARVEREVLEPIRARLAGSQAAQRAIRAFTAEIASLDDSELLLHEARINQLIGAVVPSDGVLAGLSADRRSDLERFLQTAGVSLVTQQRD